MKAIRLITLASFSLIAWAQQPAPAQPAALQPMTARPAAEAAAVVVPAGTRIPLQLINRISTKNAHDGDQVYLQSAFPIVINNRVVIPPGSYVRGTVTQSKRPGRITGKGELYLRFDSLTLPNGVTRDFRGTVGAIDGSSSDTLDKKEGKVVADAGKGKDLATVGTIAATGAGIGAIASSGARGMGTGIGAGAGVLVGLATVLLTRGPEAVLERGSTVDMILDRELSFKGDDLNFSLSGTPAAVQIMPSQPTSMNPVSNPTRLPSIPR